MKKLLLPAALCLLLAACNNGNDNEDLTHEVDHKGSVESSIQVSEADSSHKVLVTTHKIWVHDSVYRTIVYRDTLPALGVEHTVAENEDGDTKNVTVNRDYEIYITVK